LANSGYLFLSAKPDATNFDHTLLLSDGHLVLPTASARNLGFISDSHLSFSDHISSVSRACFYHIHDLRRIRHVLDFDTIGTSFVHS